VLLGADDAILRELAELHVMVAQKRMPEEATFQYCINNNKIVGERESRVVISASAKLEG